MDDEVNHFLPSGLEPRHYDGQAFAHDKGGVMRDLDRGGDCPRLGFTLIDLLVVIAIIGVLVGLLSPVVQTARELQAARNDPAAATVLPGHLCPSDASKNGTTGPYRLHWGQYVAISNYITCMGRDEDIERSPAFCPRRLPRSRLFGIGDCLRLLEQRAGWASGNALD